MNQSNIVIDYPGDRRLFVSLVHQSTEDLDILEEVFAQYNHGSGQECQHFLNNKMRSLSVGDFVNVNDQWWECASVGWKKVDSLHVSNFTNAVARHPKLTEYGAWVVGEMIRRNYV